MRKCFFGLRAESSTWCVYSYLRSTSTIYYRYLLYIGLYIVCLCCCLAPLLAPSLSSHLASHISHAACLLGWPDCRLCSGSSLARVHGLHALASLARLAHGLAARRSIVAGLSSSSLLYESMNFFLNSVCFMFAREERERERERKKGRKEQDVYRNEG